MKFTFMLDVNIDSNSCGFIFGTEYIMSSNALPTAALAGIFAARTSST